MTWTELHEAAQHRDLPHVIQLAQQHSDQANKVDDHGLTPLHILTLESPSLEAVKALLQAFPLAVSEPDVHGDTPLHLAAGSPTATKDLVQLLLDTSPTSVSRTNREGLMPLHMACRYAPQNEGVIGLLVQTYPQALRVRIKVRCLSQLAEWFFGNVASTELYSKKLILLSLIMRCLDGQPSSAQRKEHESRFDEPGSWNGRQVFH